MLFSHGRLFPSVVYNHFYIQWPQSSTCFFFHFSVIFYANYFQVLTSACFSQPPSFDFLIHDCRTHFSFNCVQGNFLFLRINVPATFIFKSDPSSREHLTRFDGRSSLVSCRTIDPITGLCLHCHLCCTFHLQLTDAYVPHYQLPVIW